MYDQLRTRRAHARRLRTVAVGLSATLALSLSACGGGDGDAGGGSAPGVSDDTIKLGTTQPLTGAAAPGYARISKAMQAWFEHVNENGGVHGRTIELLVEDDGYNPTKTAEKTRKLVLQDKVFALVGALGTPTHSSVLDFIRQNKVPDFGVSSGSLSWNQPDKAPYTFGWQVDYTREAKILATYAKDRFAGKTFCSFGQGDDFGADGVAGLKHVLGDDGLKAEESYTVSNTDVAPQIGKLQAAGCDVVFAFTIPGFTALATGTAAKLGYQPQWIVSNVGADPNALKGYLKDDTVALTDGMLTGQFMALATDADNSWVKLFSEINSKYNPDIPYDFTVQYGFALAYTATQALLAAGEELTRESFVEAIEKGGFEGPGLVPLAYSEDDHSGYTGAQVVEIKDLAFSAVSPTYTTDAGDGAVEQYDGTLAEAPTSGMPE